MKRELVDKYIVLPLAIKTFRDDAKIFKTFKMGNLYLDVVEATIDKLIEDFYILKDELQNKYHLNIKQITPLKYSVNGLLIKYTSKELKEIKSHIMSEYLQDVKARKRERLLWSYTWYN